MVETLIASSALILGICLLRFLLKGRISPQIQYAMWLIVALRLVMPWFYPLSGWLKTASSPVSVMNAAGTVRRMAAQRPGMEPLMNNLSTGQVTRYADPVTMAERAAGIDWQLVILMVWGIGGILIFAWMLYINLRFSWGIYKNREAYAGDTYGATELPVYCVQNLSTPCYMVFLGDRAIYIPCELAGQGEKLRHVLIHEDCHAQRRDHVWSALRCVLLCYYWINPLVWAAAFMSKRDCELACDADAVKRLGEAERFAYGRTLIDMTAKRWTATGCLNISLDMWNGKRAVRERISILAKHPKTTKVMAVILALALLGLALCTYTGQKRQDDIDARAEQWTEQFIGRNGKGLYEMYDPEHRDGFYKIDMVMSEPEDSYISFGWSSPWPMDGKYNIETEGTQSVITYYAMTSDPHRWVWKERLDWKQTGGTWYVEQEHFKEYDKILSAAEFYEAYAGGIAGTAMDYRQDSMGEALNQHAVTDAVYGDLLSPELAMEYLLNLHGGVPETVERDGNVIVIYTFADGSRAAVTMIQPFGDGGIWIPDEVADAGDAGLEGTDTGTAAADTITSADVVLLADIKGREELAEVMSAANFPAPDHVDGKENDSYTDWSEAYLFSYEQEPYQLLISYSKEDDSLSDITLMRMDTSEWLNIYRTPEDVKHYGMTLADEAAVREFFDTHENMSNYLTYRLPPELSNGGYSEMIGTSNGGNLFLTSAPAAQKRLEDLSRFVNLESVPESWRAAGAVERYTGGWPSFDIREGNLMKVGQPWNHSVYVGEPVFVADCEVPAMLILVSHDMYTAASLADAEAEHGPIPEENQTSRMWYVFFAREGCEEVYSISLNGDLYESTDLLKIARSVHFTEQAWSERKGKK